MFVLEDLVVKKYATGEQTFGTSWMLSSDSGFESLKQVIVHEKHVKVMKKMCAYVVIRYTALEDGTLKIGQQTVVSLNYDKHVIIDIQQIVFEVVSFIKTINFSLYNHFLIVFVVLNFLVVFSWRSYSGKNASNEENNA